MTSWLLAAAALVVGASAAAAAATRAFTVPRRTWLVSALALLTLSLLAEAPAVIDHLWPRAAATTSGWAADVLSLTAMYCVVGMVSNQAGSDERRRRLLCHGWLLLLAASVMAAHLADLTDPRANGTTRPVAVLTYLIPYLAYLAIVALAAVNLAMPWTWRPGFTSRATAHSGVVALGACVIVLGSGWSRVHVIAAQPRLTVAELPLHASSIVQALGAVIIAAGVAGPGAISEVRRRRRTRHVRDLVPLWRRITQAAPAVVGHHHEHRRDTTDPELRLYLLVIDILDGWRYLHQLVPDHQRTDASTVHPHRFPTRAAIRADAVALLAGLQAAEAGHQRPGVGRPVPVRLRNRSIDTLARWLVAVAQAMDHISSKESTARQ